MRSDLHAVDPAPEPDSWNGSTGRSHAEGRMLRDENSVRFPSAAALTSYTGEIRMPPSKAGSSRLQLFMHMKGARKRRRIVPVTNKAADTSSLSPDQADVLFSVLIPASGRKRFFTCFLFFGDPDHAGIAVRKAFLTVPRAWSGPFLRGPVPALHGAGPEDSPAGGPETRRTPLFMVIPSFAERPGRQGGRGEIDAAGSGIYTVVTGERPG